VTSICIEKGLKEKNYESVLCYLLNVNAKLCGKKRKIIVIKECSLKLFHKYWHNFANIRCNHSFGPLQIVFRKIRTFFKERGVSLKAKSVHDSSSRYVDSEMCTDRAKHKTSFNFILSMYKIYFKDVWSVFYTNGINWSQIVQYIK